MKDKIKTYLRWAIRANKEGYLRTALYHIEVAKGLLMAKEEKKEKKAVKNSQNT